MTSEQPHPQRCETCTHYGGHICYFQHNRMSNIELTLIEMVGCASHSAAPERLCDECNIIEVEERLINAEQDLKNAIEQAKREERERVLKALHRDFGGRRVEEAIEEIWRFPESLRGEQHGRAESELKDATVVKVEK